MTTEHTHGYSAAAVPAAAKQRPQPPLLQKHHCRGMVSIVGDALWQKLESACTEIRTIGPRACLSKAGEPLARSALLLEGMMARYIGAPGAETGGRLMVSLQVPGDFVDLHALPLGRLDHDVTALSAAKIALFPHDALLKIMEDDARDARMLWHLTMIDAAIHRHWIYRGGRLRALPAVADFLCEMDIRMRACGEVRDGKVPLPLTQVDLAEVSGLSVMHVGRVSKDLRDAGQCTLRDGFAEIRDRRSLRRLAGYDPSYLYHLAGLALSPDEKAAAVQDGPGSR